MADSAQLVDLASSSSRVWVDLGSGAGFPGLVLAILLGELRPDARVHLVESNGKKVAFLREVARQTGTSVEIHGARIELLVDTRRIESVDVVTARALAPLGKLLGYAYPLYDANTIGLFLKGRDVEQEIEAAKADWHFDVALEPSRTDAHGRIAVVRSLKPTREG
jgi:16S rRNA (guanine527-N7)-methyltransferase